MRRPSRAPAFTREVKHPRKLNGHSAPSIAPPVRRATRDRGGIRVWNANDVSKSEEERFERQYPTDLQQKQQAIAAACKLLQARLYSANDPSVYEELAQRELDCWAVGNSLSHIVEVPRPSDGSPRHWRVYAKDAANKNHNAHHTRLGQSLFALWPNARKIVSDPRAPWRPRWWECIKDMRKRWDEQ